MKKRKHGQRAPKTIEHYKQRNVEIEKMFRDGYSQYAISKVFGITRERVRQILKKTTCG